MAPTFDIRGKSKIMNRKFFKLLIDSIWNGRMNLFIHFNVLSRSASARSHCVLK